MGILSNERLDELTGSLKMDTSVLDGAKNILSSLNQKQDEKEKEQEGLSDEEKENNKGKENTAVQTDDGTFRAANAELDRAIEIDKDMEAQLELKDVVAPTTLAETAIKQMESVDMSKLIGAPMNAAVAAQFDAARKMLACVKEIGVKDNTLATVTFNFFKNGKKATMTVPLLTMVPINAMRIKELTYAFKLKIDTESSVTLQTGVEKSVGYGNSTPAAKDAKGGTGAAAKSGGDKTGGEKTDSTAVLDAVKDVKKETTFATTFSSKKDSRATQNSKYNVETTMDINMTIAPEESQPAGISKMLEILTNTIDVHNPNGELIVDERRITLVNGVAMTSVQYINGEGLYEPGKVTCKLTNAKDNKIRVIATNNGDTVTLIFVEAGIYEVTAGKLNEIIVVDAPAPAKETKTETAEPAADKKTKKGTTGAPEEEDK